MSILVYEFLIFLRDFVMDRFGRVVNIKQYPGREQETVLQKQLAKNFFFSNKPCCNAHWMYSCSHHQRDQEAEDN